MESTHFKHPETQQRDGQIAYVFQIIKSEISSTMVLTNKDTQQLTPWLNVGFGKFISNFITFANSFFSKKYTEENFKKYLKHSIITHLDNNLVGDVIHIYPDSFVFTLKGVTLNWRVEKAVSEDGSFEFPDLIMPPVGIVPAQVSAALSAPSAPSVLTHTENTAKNIVTASMAIPIQSEQQSTSTIQEVDDISSSQPVLDLDQKDDSEDAVALVKEMARVVERSKVREARLKAKIARLKAERSTEKYLTKYGETYSDLDDSEYETETETEQESEDENNNQGNGVNN